MAVQKINEGYVFFNSIYIWEQEKPSGALLTLRNVMGPSVAYDKDRENIVDYPGEYELSWYHILVLSDPSNDLLNYVISFQNKSAAYIQNKEVLDDEKLSDVDVRYITSSSLQDHIEKREFEWEIELLE